MEVMRSKYLMDYLIKSLISNNKENLMLIKMLNQLLGKL